MTLDELKEELAQESSQQSSPCSSGGCDFPSPAPNRVVGDDVIRRGERSCKTCQYRPTNPNHIDQNDLCSLCRYKAENDGLLPSEVMDKKRKQQEEFNLLFGGKDPDDKEDGDDGFDPCRRCKQEFCNLPKSRLCLGCQAAMKIEADRVQNEIRVLSRVPTDVKKYPCPMCYRVRSERPGKACFLCAPLPTPYISIYKATKTGEVIEVEVRRGPASSPLEISSGYKGGTVDGRLGACENC